MKIVVNTKLAEAYAFALSTIYFFQQMNKSNVYLDTLNPAKHIDRFCFYKKI
jgi:hypothetical protein